LSYRAQRKVDHPPLAFTQVLCRYQWACLRDYPQIDATPSNNVILEEENGTAKKMGRRKYRITTSFSFDFTHLNPAWPSIG